MKHKEQMQEILSTPSKDLNEKIKELNMLLTQSHGFIKKDEKTKRGMRKNIRKNIARIKGELSTR